MQLTPTPTQQPTHFACNSIATPANSMNILTTSTKVLLHTTAGDITLELRNDKPITTANFINIVKKGWYDGTIFHRVIARLHDSRRQQSAKLFQP